MTLTTDRFNEIYENPEQCSYSEIQEMAAMLANREAQPVAWGSPKTVGQLIGQLKTLDPAMETTALLRMPDDFQDGNAVKQVPITISFEKLNGHWLAPYKGDGRKVLAFWAKADHREETERGELFTAPPAPVVNQEFTGATAVPELIITAPVEAMRCGPAASYVMGWNACRAAMLAQPVSQGCKLVPVEPTEEMIAAAMNCDDVSFNADETFCVNFDNIYRAMLAAAPEGGNEK